MLVLVLALAGCCHDHDDPPPSVTTKDKTTCHSKDWDKGVAMSEKEFSVSPYHCYSDGRAW